MEASGGLTLLTSIARDALTGAVFEALLVEYLHVVAALEHPGTSVEQTRFESMRTLLVAHFVVAMLDQHPDVLVADVVRGVRVIKLFLDTGHNVGESLALLLALLQAHEHLCKADAEILQQLLPSLEGLKFHEVRLRSRHCSPAVMLHTTMCIQRGGVICNTCKQLLCFTKYDLYVLKIASLKYARCVVCI